MTGLGKHDKRDINNWRF